jgi:hypothetical protein
MRSFSDLLRSTLARRRQSAKLRLVRKALAGARLTVEGLEDRRVLSAFFVEPLSFPVDGAHFHTLQDALGVAKTGDLVQIEPGANTASAGSTIGALTAPSTLVSVTAPGAQSIKVSNFIGAGEAIQIGSGGASQETDLIQSVVPASGGQFTLNLAQPLTNAHVLNERVDTLGELGIGAGITLQGDTVGAPVPLISPLLVWTGTTGASFNSLTFESSVTLLAGSSTSTFTASVFGAVTENGSAAGNGGHNAFQQDTFTGPVSLTGNPSGTATADQILNSAFSGGLLALASDDSAVVQGNTFNDVGNVSALTIVGSQNVVISSNAITIVNGGGALTGPVGLTVGSNTSGALSVSVVSNTFNTNGTGTGILVATPATQGGNIRALIQGNDFHFDLIGIADRGDGTASANSAGIIDAGVGVLGGLGGNNFRQFQPADAAAGNRFAIYVFNTQGANGSINAGNNLFGSFSLLAPGPSLVVKDAGDNAAAGASLPPGTGTIIVGTASAQLSADQQFVQAVFNDFLGRSGALDELNGWVAVLPTIGNTGAANSIIRSPEALTRLVDGFYQKYLGRTADPAGAQAWVTNIENGMTEEQVISGFLGAPEYLDHLQSTGNSPDAAYVQSLYNVLLGRVGANSEVASWVEGLNRGMSRGQVALAFTESAEYRTISVQQYYFALLHRQAPPTADEVSAWVTSQVDLLRIQADFAGSAEFYTNG